MSIPAAQIFYAARVPVDWRGGDQPGDLDDALDQLADWHVWDITDIQKRTYTASVGEAVRIDPR